MSYFFSAKKKPRVYNLSLLATISGLGLCVGKIPKFQDTKTAVIACLMSKRKWVFSCGWRSDGDAEGRVEDEQQWHAQDQD